MNGLYRRALCAAAGVLALASTAQAAAPVAAVFLPFAVPVQAVAGAIDLSRASALPTVSYGPPPSARLAVSNVATSISLVTGLDLELGYKVDLTGRITLLDASDAHSFDGLFLSSASAGMPYNSLADGGSYLGASAQLTGDLHISLGVSQRAPGISDYTQDASSALARIGGVPAPYDQRAARSVLAGVSWDIGKWGELGVIGSQSAERDGILGNAAPGANANTSALGVSAKVRLGNGWVTTASYSEGITQLDLKPGLTPSLASDSLRTRSYGIAIAKNGLFGDDALGLAVSRPALGAGDGEFVSMAGAAGGAAFLTRNHLFEGAAPETDVEIGYITTFMDGSVALQTNASFQMNYAGQNGANAVSLLSRARIKF